MIAYQITLVRVNYFQTSFWNVKNFPAKSKFSAATTFLAYPQALIVPLLPYPPSCWDVRRKWREAYRTALMTHFDQLLLIIYWRWIGNSLCWNSSLKVIHLTWGQCFDHHGMLYIISNLPKVAIWRSKDFRIRPLMAEKSTTLLFRGTFGHTVVRWINLASGLTSACPQTDRRLRGEHWLGHSGLVKFPEAQPIAATVLVTWPAWSSFIFLCSPVDVFLMETSRKYNMSKLLPIAHHLSGLYLKK